ncbi:LCP family protein [Kitasatospora sp. NPDC088346]|uniref:LCP family protein n=1 Tax=Kitasatospora sp. NPDC088346 TaxID=3364073 RepID=UPI0038238B74
MIRNAEPIPDEQSDRGATDAGSSGTGSSDTGSPSVPGARRAARQQAGRSGRRKQKTGARRWLKPLGITVALTVVAGCGSAYLYYQHLNGNFHAGTNNLSDAQGAKTAPNAAGQTPLNILMIGTDSRASEANVALGGGAADSDRAGLADVQMLLHISADRSNASMISIPRDTMVDMPSCRSEDGKKTYPAEKHVQINEALLRGGPGCVVGTWISLTGLNIDHYMMVDFAGVVRMADAVGGVPVCVNMNMYDRQIPGIGGTGLKLPAGTSIVKGEQALQWLRIRDAWGSDLGRAQAQHMYLGALMRQLKSSGSLTDPGKLMGLAEAATKSLSVDKPLADIKKLYDLGDDLKAVPPERTSTLTVPVLEDPRDHNRLVMTQPDTSRIWKMLLSDTPLDGQGKPDAAASSPAAAPSPTAPSAPAAPQGPAPDTVAVTVQNGTKTPERASAVKNALVEAGFSKATTAPGGGSRTTTQLTYGSGRLADAQVLAAALHLPDSALKESGSSRTLSLVIGADWASGTTFTGSAAAAEPAPTALPSSVEADSANNDKSCMKVVPQGGRYTY